MAEREKEMLKKTAMVKVYKCYDRGKYLTTGTRRKFLEMLDMPEGISLANYRLNRYRGRYHFEPTGEKIKEELPSLDARAKRIEKQKGIDHEQILDYLFKHLFRDGVTCLKRDDPENYLEELAEMGLDVEYRETWGHDENGKRTNKYYVLKVVNRLDV